MFRAVVALALASVLLAALAMISCLSVEDKTRLRGLPRWAWVLVILFIPTAGPIAYFLAGRPLPPGRTLGGLPEPPRPRAPDDDPDFLRSLDQPTITKEDQELLEQWEEDLRRREEERRRGDRDT